jgi:hypothetical protein
MGKTPNYESKRLLIARRRPLLTETKMSDRNFTRISYQSQPDKEPADFNRVFRSCIRKASCSTLVVKVFQEEYRSSETEKTRLEHRHGRPPQGPSDPSRWAPAWA